jgi:site-specific recombinase XerD
MIQKIYRPQKKPIFDSNVMRSCTNFDSLQTSKYGVETGITVEVKGLCVHSLRATAATNALSHDADIAKVQDWLGHANVSTTRLYDRR